jgi:hypothetical protein
MNYLYIDWQSSAAIVAGYGPDISGSLFLSARGFYFFPPIHPPPRIRKTTTEY